MKKMFVTAATALLCFLAYSQEADELGKLAEFSVIARGEYLYSDPLGNSSLYTLLDGSFSEHLSYSVSNHWLSSDPKSLYTNTFHSDYTNWLDWAFLTYTYDNVGISVGKAPLLWGTYEFDEYDFDIHYPFASSVWSELSCYQWGGSLSWTIMDVLTLEAGVSTSPYGERPFTSGLYVAGLRAIYDSDYFGFRAAYNHFGVGDGECTGVYSCGIRGKFAEKFSLTLDAQNAVGDSENIFIKGESARAALDYSACDSFQILLNAGWEHYDAENADLFKCGAALHYYPVENLRLHALGAYNFGMEGIEFPFVFSVGATITLSKEW